MKPPKLNEIETAYFTGFDLDLPAECVLDCTVPGQDADEPVAYWSGRIQRPPEATPEAVREHLAGYGAWDDEELQDDAANWHRIVWIAAGNIRDEAHERETYPERYDAEGVPL